MSRYSEKSYESLSENHDVTFFKYIFDDHMHISCLWTEELDIIWVDGQVIEKYVTLMFYVVYLAANVISTRTLIVMWKYESINLALKFYVAYVLKNKYGVW